MSNEPVCHCGEKCWAADNEEHQNEPCWGEMNVSEDHPGEYHHFCDGHGHVDDGWKYRPDPFKKKTPG